MYTGLHVKYPLFIPDFNQTWIFLTDFQKTIKYQMSSISVQWAPGCSMHTDRHRGRWWTARQTCMTVLCTFTNVPKNYNDKEILKQNVCSPISLWYKKLHLNMIYKHFSNNSMLESVFISSCQHYVRKSKKMIPIQTKMLWFLGTSNLAKGKLWYMILGPTALLVYVQVFNCHAMWNGK